MTAVSLLQLALVHGVAGATTLSLHGRPVDRSPGGTLVVRPRVQTIAMPVLHIDGVETIPSEGHGAAEGDGPESCHVRIARIGGVLLFEVDRCDDPLAAAVRDAMRRWDITAHGSGGAAGWELLVHVHDGAPVARVGVFQEDVADAAIPATVDVWTRPRARRRVAPTFPAQLRGASPEECVVRMTIDARGRAMGASATECAQPAAESVEDAFDRWRFEPATCNGTPTAVTWLETAAFATGG